jgi:hypothetical protein
MVARAIESWWSGCGLVVARARVLAVELQWSGSGFMVARARLLCGSSFAAVALRQLLFGSAAVAASLAEVAAALPQCGVGCSSSSGQLGGGMIINKIRNSLWV